MAMGATSSNVFQLVLRQGTALAGAGLAIGLVSSAAVNRLLRSQLVRVSPSDPIALVAASVVLILAALLGCWVPARRAMRVDPANAIRHE